MSHITEALNKAQELRQDHRGQKKAGDFKPQPISRMLVISIIVTGAIVAFFINVVIIMFVIRSTKLNQKKIYNLEKSLKTQKKEMNNLIAFRLKNEIEDRKNQINNVGLIDNVYYINIMKSIIANTHQINYLVSVSTIFQFSKNFKQQVFVTLFCV